MKSFRLLISLALLATLVFGSAYAALAWPDTPPDSAFITGPGLDGKIEIRDKTTLDALQLGSIENFEQRLSIEPPVSGEGYTITRYFYEGSFNFATLHYYPNPEGADYIFFEDGDDVEGNHTLYHNRWFYATPEGEAAVERLLQSLGIETTNNPNPSSVVTAAAPSVIEVINRYSVGLIIMVAGLVFGWFFLNRRNQTADLNSR